MSWPEGMITDREAECLEELASQLSEGKLAVEIGSWKGKSTVALGKGMARSGGRVVAIDWGEGCPKDWANRRDKEIFQYWEELENNLMKSGVVEQVEIIREDSLKVGEGWSRGPIHLFFLDGQHEEEQVEKECRIFKPYWEHGAILVFHDWFFFHGVSKGVKKVLHRSELEHLKTVDGMVVYRYAL